MPIAPSDLLDQIEADLLKGGNVSDVLRKCVLLGGRIGSAPLREWASRELNGYARADALPEYRVVAAAIYLDGATMGGYVRGQQVSPFFLPDFVQKVVKEEFHFADGVGHIEQLAAQAERDEGVVKLALPDAAGIAAYMNSQSGTPYQKITSLYWQVSAATLHGVVDRVRTALAELIAEIRAGTPAATDGPSADVANQAVNVAVFGAKARVTVTAAQSTGDAAQARVNPERRESGFWTLSRRMGAAVVGLASLIGVFITVWKATGH